MNVPGISVRAVDLEVGDQELQAFSEASEMTLKAWRPIIVDEEVVLKDLYTAVLTSSTLQVTGPALSECMSP